MAATENIRKRVELLMTSPGQELGRWARMCRFQIRLWRYCARRLWENNVTAMSAALSFRTIFALVPTLVLAVLVLQPIGALDDSKAALRKFLHGSGFAQIAMVDSETAVGPVKDEGTLINVPAPGDVVSVADEIERMVESVESKLTFARVGPIGAVLLVWTALSLVTTTERSLNRIFGAVRTRSLGRRLLLYWSVVTLGPLVSVAAGYIGGVVVEEFKHAPGASFLLAAAGWMMPLVVGVLVVGAVYKLLPNTEVRFRSAAGGALVSVPLWMLAKWGFSVYVTRFVGSGNLYGALGLLPLFLIWLNLSWLIFLFGAQLAHTATHLDSIDAAATHEATALDVLAAAVATAQAFIAGETPITAAGIAGRIRQNAEVCERLMQRLVDLGIVCPVESADAGAADSVVAYVPSKPPEKIPLTQIWGVTHASNGPTSVPRYGPDVAGAVDRATRITCDAMGSCTLADVVAAGGSS